MREKIKDVKRSVIRWIHTISWQRQYKELTSTPRKVNFVLSPDWIKGEKSLLMVPHADDELISSYSILCKNNPPTLFYCGFTGSNHDVENKRLRREELMRICEELNLNVIEGDANCENLEKIIAQGGYESIIIPSIVDWHDEHRKISYMICEICEKLSIKPRIYCYSVTVPNESLREVMCVPMTKEQLNNKYKLFKKVYLSQKMMPTTRLQLNERVNGFHAGCFATETFVGYGFDEWKKMISRVEVEESMQDTRLMEYVRDLRKNLNNLINLRETSSLYYNWIENEQNT